VPRRPGAKGIDRRAPTPDGTVARLALGQVADRTGESRTPYGRTRRAALVPAAPDAFCLPGDMLLSQPFPAKHLSRAFRAVPQIPNEMNVCHRLLLPDSTGALLWDMDGVLIDSLAFAIQATCRLVLQRHDIDIADATDFIKSVFPHEPPEYWRRIVVYLNEQRGAAIPLADAEALCDEYVSLRLTSAFPIQPGIREILSDLDSRRLPCAVVSNNPLSQNLAILSNCGLADRFAAIVGNDRPDLRKKPAPDTYLAAAEQLGIDAARCVVVEDSVLGATAGIAAGCRTIGVATGSASVAALEDAGCAQVYSSFTENACALAFGNVRVKSIVTPNEFVSHMVEHIAWRLGTTIKLSWNNNDYRAAGELLGTTLRRFTAKSTSAACLGMIDDGSAEVLVALDGSAGQLRIVARGDVSLDWFLSLRCEQLRSGAPLQDLLGGFAAGLGASIDIAVCSAEDPHHTWEGVFRAIGIALSRIYSPSADSIVPQYAEPVESLRVIGDISIRSVGSGFCEVTRRTAESEVAVAIDFSRLEPSAIRLQVGPTISTEGFADLLLAFADNAGISLQLSFTASVLSSSHVLFEDAALVIGRALLELLAMRMTAHGAEGAGSNIRSAADLQDLPVGVAVSVEGRKFWSFVPFAESYSELRRRILVGQTVFGSLRSEDLDDFVDGLAGGLSASVMIHIRRPVSPEETWLAVFSGLGQAIAESFLPNPFRQGVPPGVKGTLS
jgi:HAD superfamily hydrolase (TIGR01509 family)